MSRGLVLRLFLFSLSLSPLRFVDEWVNAQQELCCLSYLLFEINNVVGISVRWCNYTQEEIVSVRGNRSKPIDIQILLTWHSGCFSPSPSLSFSLSVEYFAILRIESISHELLLPKKDHISIANIYDRGENIK